MLKWTEVIQRIVEIGLVVASYFVGGSYKQAKLESKDNKKASDTLRKHVENLNEAIRDNSDLHEHVDRLRKQAKDSQGTDT